MTRTLVAALVLVAATAHADPRVKSPGAADYAAGVALFEKGDYKAAVERFKAAYAADDDAAYLFNIAQAYRLAHDCHQAAQFYRAFLAAMPSPPNLADVKRWLAEVDECDTERAERPPPDEDHAPPVHHAAPSDDGSGKRHLATAAAITGVVALGVAGYFTYDAGQIASEREALCASGCIWSDVRARATDLDARGTRAEALAITGYAVATAAIAGSVALFVVAGHHEHAVAAAPVQGGAMFVVGGSL